MDDATKLWHSLISENERFKAALNTLKYMIEADKAGKSSEQKGMLDEDEIYIVLKVAGMCEGDAYES